ncbi:Na+/H+ antiporter NhaC family protein [Staphylococcus felis]|uniref:Na+/H+ antiporter NhaC family protein n=1 Tax=Staphylococcus felis TaxID=46127 RepID=A0AAQ0HRU3_9STAP|nr:Na+/H+ antiporter NhaC family protein [Staphylococcus felis]AVP37636.1 sodium:proton antiporter [Staphylococcus felis]MBH9581079.1 Na+/H+ antiporter NhaC family protein [Staphylococcus felis]MDM8326873.1 Na+/H+ antiporter NhaC family protein [Staphylococcus felis]PNZ35038.1 sodium:proton antiporter [Staphylococcus felis]QQB04429.1 Na+/H+ antiporter NhaC family protein [Staphylococcus felis]
MQKENEKGHSWGLIPLIVFIGIFLGSGIVTQDFTFMPLNVAAIIGVIVALMMKPKEKWTHKVEVFAQKAGHPNIVLMMLIFILAGAFSKTAEAMGGVSSIVNLGLSLIPQNFLIVGIFLICMFISISMGTSVGTVAAIAPVGFGISEATDIPAALAMATVVGGAMFGDNLSMISDTTIAAVRTQHTKMSDKFKVNFRIVLPGAIVTLVILWWLTYNSHIDQTHEYDFEFIKVIPYLFVLILAIIGVNVILVLLGGIALSGIIGMLYQDFKLAGFLKAASEGIVAMEDIAMIALLIGGMIGLVEYYGGITWLLNFVENRIRSRRGAEFGIAGLVSVADISTANNTISIIMTGPLAKDIAKEYDIDPRKSASILDIFGSAFQGFIPYSPQLIAAAGVAGISPVMLLPYSIYPVMLALCGVISIIFGWPKLKR